MTKEEEEKLIEQQKLMFEEMQGQDEEAEDEPEENEGPATATDEPGMQMTPQILSLEQYAQYQFALMKPEDKQQINSLKPEDQLAYFQMHYNAYLQSLQGVAAVQTMQPQVKKIEGENEDFD